ncbi:hypothetical protein [Streptomyces sp. SID13726]|uniref:hypothetical protein n=1 Tax=Streptomyces sp. SID13726 TaxID=2706058 RepID=UPI0013BAC15A|nr:hypothetical protein [Streptomyces sp. SID13726]NEA99586.1 hypothetical protein [Streptomyces sp. SID13726]
MPPYDPSLAFLYRTAPTEVAGRSYDLAQYHPGREITDWEPENEFFWNAVGRRVARRSLRIAVLALVVAFVVWQVWSVTATDLADVGFAFTTSQLFWLTATPGLTDGTSRMIYTFLGPRIGRRAFTALSTAVLVVPLIWLGLAIQDPSTSFTTMATIAALCGIGGANFPSSLANSSFPKREKGNATGVNGALGNLGVSAVQLLTPGVITMSVIAIGSGRADTRTDETVYLQNAAFVWVPIVLALAALSWFGQNHLRSVRRPSLDSG